MTRLTPVKPIAYAIVHVQINLLDQFFLIIPLVQLHYTFKEYVYHTMPYIISYLSRAPVSYLSNGLRICLRS